MRPPTLVEYRRLNLTRPLTDDPIGGKTDARRDADAQASKAISESLGHGHLWPGNHPADTSAGSHVHAGPGPHHGRHGTRSGYQTHLRLGETPCRACKAANAEYQRRRNSAA